MEDFQLSNDFNQVEESDGFELLPKGDYKFRATDIQLKSTKDGSGKYFNVTFDVTEGPLEGRKVFQNFNVVNKNPDAVQIGLGEIKAWFRACYGDQVDQIGQLMASHVAQLEGVEFVATVGIEKDKSGQYGDKNKIVKFKPQGTALDQPATQQSAPAFQQQQAATQQQATQQQPAQSAPQTPSFLKK